MVLSIRRAHPLAIGAITTARSIYLVLQKTTKLRAQKEVCTQQHRSSLIAASFLNLRSLPRQAALSYPDRSIFRHRRTRLISERTLTSPRSPSTSRFPRLGLSHVWVRFLVALVGLALAFGAALFSTVSREAGSVCGTILMASVALLLATFVGLTTVPYLARRVVASRVREAMDYDVTRAGMIYILISVVI